MTALQSPIDAVLEVLAIDAEGAYVLPPDAAQRLIPTWESLMAEGDALEVFGDVLRCCTLLENRGAHEAAQTLQATLGPWLHLAAEAGLRKAAFATAQQDRARSITKTLLGGPAKPGVDTTPLPVNSELKLEFESMRKQQDFSADRRRAGAKSPKKPFRR